MSSSEETSSTQSRVAGLTTPTPVEVRTSKQRAGEIKQYILGLLPAHLSKTVDVVITENVPTAAVLPATEDALITDDQTAFDRQQARNLIESVDGDYLVLITGRETPDAGPLNDELSADRAHQFGLAFHETLHILKTAFAGVQTLLDERVDDQYQEFVHGLINATEDGAIEYEVYVGDDFSRRAGNRLRLVREIHKRSPEDYEDLPSEQTQFTFRDALQKAIHDNVILPPSGTTSALLDEDDDRVTFESRETRAVFEEIYPEIEALAADIHSIRGDVGTDLHKNDIEASIRRAKRTIQFWADVVKPILSNGSDGECDEQGSDQKQARSQEQDQRQEKGKPHEQEANRGQESAEANQDSNRPESSQQSGTEGTPSPDAQPENGGSDADNQPSAPADGSSGADPQNASGQVPASDIDVDPDDLSLDQNAVSDSLQGVADHPSVTDEPNPDDVDLDRNQSGNDDTASGEVDAESDVDKQDGKEQGVDAEHSEMADAGGSPDDLGATTGSGDEASVDHSDEESAAQRSDCDSSGVDDANAGSSGGSEGDNETDGSSAEEGSSSTASNVASSTQSSTESSKQSTFGDFTQGDTPGEVNKAASENGDHGESGRDDSEAIGNAESDTDAGDGEPGKRQSPTNSGPSEQAESSAQTDAATESSAGTGQTGTQQETDAQQATTGRDGAQSDTPSGQVCSEAQTTDTSNRTDNSGSNDDVESSTATDGVSGLDHDPDELTADDFESDRKRAQHTANEISADTDGLDRELQRLDNVLGDDVDQNPNGKDGGTGAGLGSVDELEVLPSPEDSSKSTTAWEDVEESASTVADTLAKQLRLDQQTGSRSGLSSGTKVNRKTAYRLGHNDPRVFEEDIPGDEKEYFIVIVLDRSGSMDPMFYNEPSSSDGPAKIDIATSAVARFVVACEDLGIDVAVVDFYDETARLAKPASIDAEYAQDTLLSRDTGGGTPLADALSLSSSLTEMDTKESIIVSITDGKPGDVEATKDVIRSSYAPVCSLTIATDCEPGSPPEKADQLQKVYDQTATVFDPEKLDDRIDEFAALLGVY
jgi:hypothetical protein